MTIELSEKLLIVPEWNRNGADGIVFVKNYVLCLFEELCLLVHDSWLIQQEVAEFWEHSLKYLCVYIVNVLLPVTPFCGNITFPPNVVTMYILNYHGDTESRSF